VEKLTNSKNINKKGQYSNDTHSNNSNVDPLKIKGLLIDILNHDLCNTLIIVNGYTRLLKKETKINGGEPLLEKISQNIINSKAILENIIEFIKCTDFVNLELTELDLHKIIYSALKSSNLSNEHIMVENRTHSQILVKGNKILENVFINIFNNVVKHANEGKKIIIESLTSGNKQHIKIKDFGPGIEKYILENIFDRNNHGKHFGLSISRRIIELHNGKMWIDNNPDGGTIVNIVLPTGSDKERWKG